MGGNARNLAYLANGAFKKFINIKKMAVYSGFYRNLCKYNYGGTAHHDNKFGGVHEPDGGKYDSAKPDARPWG